MNALCKPATTACVLVVAGFVACAYGQRPTPPGKVAPLAQQPPIVVDPSRMYTEPEDIRHKAAPPKEANAAKESESAKKVKVVSPSKKAPAAPQAATAPGAPGPRGGSPPIELVMKGGVKYRQRIAAVIGISRYANLPPLEGAREDAVRIAGRLRAAGFDEVTELYDGAATRKTILGLLGTEIPKRTESRDLVVIYFAGHGQTETLPNGEKRGYIVPADGEKADMFSTSISMEQVRDLSNRIPAAHVYYAMDSCYSGMGFVRAVGPMKTGGFQLTTASQRAVKMITAGAEGQQAQERGGRGLFTTYLLRALDGEADSNGDKTLTADEVGDYVTEQVSAASRASQTPQYGTLEGTGEITFVLGR